MIAVAFRRKHMHDLINLLHWNSTEGQNLFNLAIHISRDNIANRKYTNICYLAESAYALSIALEDNIFSNPG